MCVRECVYLLQCFGKEEDVDEKYAAATSTRLLQIIGLFGKRAL